MREGLRRSIVLVVSASLFVVGVASVLAAQGETTLVSIQPGGGSTDGSSLRAAISASGRFVAFDSMAENLSGDDVTPRDVFVRDMNAETIDLASRRSGADGAGATDSSEQAAISANGRFVAFESEANNLSGAAKGAFDNIFVRDLEGNRTFLVSRRSASAGGTGANGNSEFPSISANGRYVAFASEAANLSRADAHDPGSGDLYFDVFVRDLKQRRTILVSRRSGAGGRAGNESSFDPSIAADGRFVSFSSRAENLSREDIAFQDIFVRDLKRARTVLASRRSAAGGGAGADDDSGTSSISANGRLVAFRSDAGNLSDADETFPDIFVRDLRRKRTSLASRQSVTAGGAGGDDSSLSPSLSANGRYVTFHSGADNLTGDDDNDETNLFVRALKEKRTDLASITTGGVGADGESGAGSLSATGRFVAFQSDAANLSGDDAHDIVLGDLYTDIFRHDLLGP